MELSIWIPKGGTGKTMTALTLAAGLAHRGRRVLVVDQDPQSGSLVWAKRAGDRGLETPFVVAAARSKGFDDVIYDHAPVPPETGLPGRLVVMPVLLDATTYPLYRRGRSMLEGLGLPHVAIPTRVRTDRAEQRVLIEQVFKASPVYRDRACFPKAYGRGQTVYSEDLGMPHALQARSEAETVLELVLSRYAEVEAPQLRIVA